MSKGGLVVWKNNASGPDPEKGRSIFQSQSLIRTLGKYIPVAGAMVLAAFFVYFPITDADIFWHLAAGREIVAQKHFLYNDPFAFTLDNPQWVDLHWLFQLLVYGLYSIGSLNALLLFKMVAVACTCALLCLAHRSHRYLLITSLTAALLLYEVRYQICIRPILITMLCMAVFILLFETARTSGKRKWLWWCVPLQMLWTNSQGLYMIGLFIIGAYWIERVALYVKNREKKPVQETIILLCAAASCLINPYGLAGLLLPFELFSRITPAVKNIYSLNIAENVPLMALTGYDAVYRHTVVVSAIIAAGGFVLNWKRAKVAHVVLYVGFLSLAFFAVRNVLLFIVIVIPIIGYNASCAEAWNGLGPLIRRHRRNLLLLAYLSGGIIVAVPVVRHAAMLTVCPPHRVLSPFRFPEKITDYMKQHPMEGEMFNDMRYGGYLIWHFYPQKRVFIDTRLIIRSGAFFAEFLALGADTSLFEKVVDRWNVTRAILPFAVFDRYHSLIDHLYHSVAWQLEYTDGASVLFVRKHNVVQKPLNLSDSATVAMLMEGIDVQWPDAPYVHGEALGYLAGLLETLGEKRGAEMVRERMRSVARQWKDEKK